VIVLVPVLSTVTPGTARVRRGRQAAVAGVTRAGADLALVLLAVVAGWQLRHYSAASAGASGNFGVDPVIVAGPALALAGGTVLAVGTRQAASVTLLRPDQSPLPAAGLFGKIRPAGGAPGVMLPGRPAGLRLAARLGPAALGLGAATVSVSVEDAAGGVYQLDAGSLPADGKDHALSISLGHGTPAAAIYPLRLAAVTLDYTLPATRARGPAVFTLDGVSGVSSAGGVAGAALRGWPAVASSADLAGAQQGAGTAGPSGMPADASARAAGSALAVTFSPGYGLAAGGLPGTAPRPVTGQLALAPAAPGVIPGLATQRYLDASNASVGSTVQTDINGTTVAVQIVAAVRTFPTVSGSGGALIVDLGALQAVLAGGSLAPAPVTQWWLATAGPAGRVPGIPPGLAARLPPGSAVTSTSAMASGLLADPLSTVPQQGLLAVVIAAAVLAVTGFCVSIAAGVRQRRAENALLAALGVAPRAAAGQLCLEKLLLSVPSALAGLVLGVVLAELLVPAITLTAAATRPVPPVLIQFGWSQTLLLALAVAVLPVLTAALTIARRPDAAAELRAAESA
jgi:FtsX-like permease family